MAETPRADVAADAIWTDVLLPRRSRASQLWLLARRKPLGAAGLLVILLFVVAAIFADVVAPYGPTETDSSARFKGHSLEHPLGTDQLGRDLFSRVIYGARLSLFVGFVVAFGSTFIGTVWALIAGYFRGIVDNVSNMLLDAIIAFPTLVLAIAMVSALGPSLQNVIIALLATSYARSARVIRSSVLSVRASNYVEAATVLGAGNVRIMFRHILPNVMAPIIILVTLGLGNVIIAEASLSFLGLGPPPPTPTWGRMLSAEGREYFTQAPWLAIWPGVALALAVYSFNMVGDALRDILDPRLRGERV